MGLIPEHKIDEVRRAADIVEVVGSRVRLIKAGRNFKGLCPFHSDSDPSLVVNPQKGSWYCFGCQKGGNVFTFLQEDQSFTFPEAVRELARRYSVELPKPKLTPAQRQELDRRELLLRVLQLAAKFFSEQLAGHNGKEARQYLLERRGLAPEVIGDFALGWAPAGWENLRRHLLAQNVPEKLIIQAGLEIPRERGSGGYDRFRERVVFPIRTLGGKVISFGGRVLGSGEPKYLNGPESPVFVKSKQLYNLDRAIRPMRRQDRALVVEGYFDVISLVSHGFAETVAPLGTALTAAQARRLRTQASDVVLIFDGDQAGRRAARRALPVLLAAEASPRVVLLPAGQDPDDFVRRHGAAALKEAVDGARPLSEVVLREILASEPGETPEDKSRAVDACREVIGALPQGAVAWRYASLVADELDLPEHLVTRQLGIADPGGRRSTIGAMRSRLQAQSTTWQRSLLSLALASPPAARLLSEDGVLATLQDAGLAAIGQAIGRVLARGAEPEPAAVVQELADSGLAGLVMRLSQEAPELEPENAQTAARTILRKLGLRRLRRQRGELSKAIAEAEAAGDFKKVAALQAQRRKMLNVHPQKAGEE